MGSTVSNSNYEKPLTQTQPKSYIQPEKYTNPMNKFIDNYKKDLFVEYEYYKDKYPQNELYHKTVLLYDFLKKIDDDYRKWMELTPEHRTSLLFPASPPFWYYPNYEFNTFPHAKNLIILLLTNLLKNKIYFYRIIKNCNNYFLTK